MAASGLVAYFVCALLTALGLVTIIAPKTMVDFRIWVSKNIMGAQYIPSQRTVTVTRLLGVLLLLIAALLAYRLMTNAV